ncbi:MAG: Na+:solute symporter [Bacteroidales bacterium]|nr:Na+:solute symporter [Bacteroidales bacterium]
MYLSILDYSIIILYLILVVSIAYYYKKFASKDLETFFLGGKNLPWYLAGLSMVATTFAADTPLAVTELVAESGVSGNWLWWNMLVGGMLTTFFFADLWRRSGVLTELEFVEFRYSGKAAAFLRGFKAIYLGVFINTLVIAWVNLALVSILSVFFDLTYTQILGIVAVSMIFAALTASMGGLKSVVVTDAIQFFIALAGAILLAVFVLNSEKIGGAKGLVEKLPASAFKFFPDIQFGDIKSSAQTLGITLGSFFAYGLIQWWASWYPGAEPGGGGYVAQRMMSAKDEKNSVFATLFFQIAHYAIRPWPWILVALASLVLYPELAVADKKLGYIMAIRDFMPSGLKGLLLVSLFAAYMSTISTQLNWGASFIVNDLYKRFLKPESTFKNKEEAQKKYIAISRITTLVIVLIGLIVTTKIETISGVWKFLLETGAGLGLVLILRWFWHRINAWSEITAIISPFFFYTIAKYGLNMEFPDGYFFTVGLTTLSWIIVSLLTKPSEEQTTKIFLERVNPGGFWPAKYNQSNQSKFTFKLLAWFSGIIFTYSSLFLTGKIIFGFWNEALIWLSVALIGLIILVYSVKRIFD